MNPVTGSGAVRVPSSQDLLEPESSSGALFCYGRLVSALPSVRSSCCKKEPFHRYYVDSPVYKPTTVAVITSQPLGSDNRGQV
ncbi:hypothetical protein [Endozoicomonas sp. GU-1]|uniref:hypothetical protein n=1 Tax=Endozoicomonas sp. GU-1 TaxID=3009078 RepID=UPI0022B2C102|nr:hypothetical protein [Endozoicomonas sp. GU-1]WBA81344.1 hypothetical protein O2T12_24185 [Endozoicomonas sp. GU-1]WBA84290.1 hypothetical protein O3276_13355 [Endozoicomonas sp. GU-1]